MAVPFLDELLPAYVEYGASFRQNHAVQIVGTQNGDEYRRLLHPFVRLDYQFTYAQNTATMLDEVVDFYQRTNGQFRAFRVRDWQDYSTNGFTGTPTSADMLCIPCTSSGVELLPGDNFQYVKLIRWYGDEDDAYCARRYIRKPVDDSTIKLASYDTGVFDAEWTEDAAPTGNEFSVDYTTGIIYLGTEITDPNITIRAGCYFDIPCRFDGVPSFAMQDYATLQGSSFAIREVFNP